MKENVLDVLMYLFDSSLGFNQDPEAQESNLIPELKLAGFSRTEIDKTLEWIAGLRDWEIQGTIPKASGNLPIRVYHETESSRLSIQARGFLLFLEKIGMVDLKTREAILDRALALELEYIGLDHFKWVVLVVFMNRDGGNVTPGWFEDLLFGDPTNNVH